MTKRSIPLPTGPNVAAFARTEAGAEQLAQAVVLVDPDTGEPNAATEATLVALGLAIGTLNAAAAAIKAAVEALNGKAITINTGAIGGTVALDAPTLAALELISVSTGLAQPLTDVQLRAAAVPVSGQFYQVTQPVSAAALPLPVGAATETTLAAVEAKLPALSGGRIPVELPAGGGALTDVQLRASSLAVTGAFVKAEDSPAADGDLGLVMLAQRRDSDTAATSTDGDYATLKMDEAGRLKVATQPGAIAATSGNITANAQSITVNVERASNMTISMVATSLVGHNISFEYSNNSTNGTDGNWYGVQVVRSNANTVETASGVLTATPAYGWEASVNAYKWFRVRATAHTSGTAAYTLLPGSYATEPIPAVQVTGTQPVSGSVTVAGTATTTPATPTPTNITSAASTNATSVKASAGTLYSVSVSNTSASTRYVKLYNKASAPAVGTDVPVFTIPVPAAGAINVPFGALGHRFATGIALAITAGAADSDTAAVVANEVKVALAYL